MQHDSATHTIRFEGYEADILRCDMQVEDSLIAELYFTAVNYVRVKEAVIDALRSSGSSSERGMIPGVQMKLNQAEDLVTSLKNTYRTLHPEAFPKSDQAGN
jgi:hypothetical protein